MNQVWVAGEVVDQQTQQKRFQNLVLILNSLMGFPQMIMARWQRKN